MAELVRRTIKNAGTSYRPLRWELSIYRTESGYCYAEIRWIDQLATSGKSIT
jgi:hypothetical protein